MVVVHGHSSGVQPLVRHLDQQVKLTVNAELFEANSKDLTA
jgi:hypothetical protein